MLNEPNGNANFYRQEAFALINKKLDELTAMQIEQNKQLAQLQRQVSQILGWAAGAGAVAGIFFSFIKDKIFHS